MFISLLLTCIFTYTTKQAVEQEANKEFSYECAEIKARVDARLQSNAILLNTGAAFFEASDSVSREEWATYINHQKINRIIPGVQGVGYAVIISGATLSEHIQHMRSTGFSEYAIKPAGNRDVYSSIVFLEPFSDRNLRAFGYDMFSEPIRRRAMQQACDSNQAALSGKVKLVQETKTDIQAGSLMYVPVYRVGMSVKTVAERRKAIKGWVYSPYRMNDLLSGILGEPKGRIHDKINLQIYDSDSICIDALLYDSRTLETKKTEISNILKLTLPVNFNGKRWLLSFTQASESASYYLSTIVLIVLFGGTIISILFALLAYAWLKERTRLKIITQLADTLKASLEKHVALYNAIPDAVFVTDSTTGLIEETNYKAAEQYGYSRQEFELLNNSALLAPQEQSELYRKKYLLYYHDTFHSKKDGSVFPVEITNSTFFLKDSLKTISVARDITSRLQAETELRIKNEVFENSIAAQSICDRDGIIILVNQAFMSMWGFNTKEVVVGKPIDSFYVDGTEAKKVFDKLSELNSWQGEFRAKRYDGSIFISYGYATCIKNKSGEIIGYQSTNLDITHEKEAEKELLQYKFAIDQAADGIVITGPDRKVIFTNQAWAKMHGFTVDELAGCDIILFHTTEQFQNDVEPFFTTLHESGSHSSEVGHKRRDGQTFPTWMSSSVLKDAKDNIIGYLGVAQDITLRKAAELALEISKEHYKRVVENANDAIVVTLPDEIAFANGKFYEILGFAENEVISGQYQQYIYPDDQQYLFAQYQKLLEGGKLVKIPSRIITKDGRIRWAEFSGVVIEWNGQGAVLSFIADITERKIAEEALHASEEVYKSTIKASPDNIIVTGLDVGIIMASPVSMPFFGLEHETQLLGHNFIDFLAPDERDRAASILKTILVTDERKPLNFKCLHSDGSLIDSEINGEVIRDIEGMPTGFVFIIRDITERKRAEEALRESEEKWRSLVSNSPDYIALHDKDGKYLFLNHFAEGFTEKDIEGHTAFDFLSPESVDFFKEKHTECIKTWKPVKFEHTAMGGNGEIRIYEETLVPLLTKNAEVNVLAVAKDITEQKQSEIKLQESEEHFRLIFEEGAISMALTSPEFNYMQVNKAFCDFLGYTEAELLCLNVADVTVPEYFKTDVEQISRLLKGEIDVYRNEKQYIRKDKEIVWGLVQVCSMYNKAGEFLSLLVMISNITDHKKAEESLMQSEEIFNQFMLNSPIYVFFKDENIRSLRLSRNFEKMLGRPLEELLGKNMDELFPSDLAKNMVADDLRILHEGKQIEVEEEMDGRYYSTTKFPIFIKGKPVYLAGYTIDITSRKLAGDMIHAALKEKEILLREVHHRVKNNLQVVSSLLNLQAGKTTDTSLKETLGQSRNRIRSIALVHEKLYQSGNFAEINIKEYTQSLVADLFRAYMTDPERIHLRTDIENVNIPLLYAIPCGLILNEIISNSLKHAFPESKTFKLKPEIFIRLKTLSDKRLELVAGDNGIGLPKNYQLSDSASLGLYLIHILSTEQLDGKMEINTQKGTIFTVTFNPFHK